MTTAARRVRWLVCLALGLTLVALSGPAYAAAPATSPVLPLFQPGKETRIDDPSLGGSNYYVVYVPPEYTPDHTWPAIFVYHGLNQKPTGYPFKDALGGKGFIIIGMPYYSAGLEAYGTVKNDIANVQRLAPVLAAHLKIDTRQMFIGGFSQGGWMTSIIGEATATLWAGMAIMGAGRHGGDAAAKTAAAFAGKPIYVGAGENDPNVEAARKAADYYKTQGADATLDIYPGKAHTVDTKSKVFADWLWSNGPLKLVKAALAEGQAAQAGGKLGLAYTKFSQAAAVPGGYEPCVEAGKTAETLAKGAEEQLAAAEAQATAKKLAEALSAYTRLATVYDGSPFGEKAKTARDLLRADPTVQAALDVAKANADAKALEERAQVAEMAKDFAAAIRLYEQIVTTCAKSDRAPAARARLDALKNDKAIQAAIRAKDAERDCRNWLSMADNFIKAGLNDRAKEYLKKITDAYGDTDWGQQARDRLKKLP